MKKTIWWIVGIIVLIIIIVAVSVNNKPSQTGPIKIGVVEPLTGDAAAYGEPLKNSLTIAVDEINRNGGVNGRQIQMIYEDGKCNGKDATSAAQKLVNIDQVKYIVGGFCSAEAFGVIPVATPANVFMISPGASNAQLAGKSQYFVRNNPSDSITGSVLADYLAKSYKTVAIVSEQTDYAQGIKSVFTNEAQKQGMTVVDSEDFNTGTADFRSILSKVKAANPDVIFINPQTPQNIIRVTQQARDLGIKSQFAGVLFGTDSSVVGAGQPVEGMIFAELSSLTSPKGLEFVTKYKSAYGKNPDYEFYDGAGYDDIYLLAQAITKVGDDPTKVQQYIHSLPSYDGVIGTYSFNQDGDMVGAGLVLQKISGGKIVNIQ